MGDVPLADSRSPRPTAELPLGWPNAIRLQVANLPYKKRRDLSDAEATRAKLALLGFEAAISDRTSDSGVLHRVRLGPYNQVEAMNQARAKLLDSGVDVAIVRNQR